MIVNGSIQALTITGGGLDSNGDPIAITEDWSDQIDCQIKTVKHDQKGVYEDGKFERSSYQIFLEIQEFPAGKIRVFNNRSQELGEFEIQDIQFLDLVQRVKITV